MAASYSPLPPMQDAWMSELLGGALPAETRATCDDCAMCNRVAPDAGSFNPDTKCCTYEPTLANFLVGQALADTDPDPAAVEGRASIEARIAGGSEVTPLGLGRSPVWGLLYRFGAARGFGRARSLLCPHYVAEGGRCGIWRHRNGVCSTWFCKHVRGAKSAVLWERVQQLLLSVEVELSTWCVLELGIGGAALASLYPRVARTAAADSETLDVADLERRGDPATTKAMWGTWAGREGEFYRACGALVAGLDFAEVVRRCGPDVRLRAELLRGAWQELAEPEPPPRLRVGQLTVLRMDAASCRVSTYSGLDPLEMPRALFDVLHRFDGRPTQEVTAGIVKDGGPRLTPGLVRKMADFSVLVPDERGPAGGGTRMRE